MQFRAKQIAPPKDWATFEDLCHALFKRIWNDPLAQKNGRRGQEQHGVDIFGSLNGDRASVRGVQCKGKDRNYGGKATLREIKAEIAKADTFEPTLEYWVFATTAAVDGALQKAARELSADRKAKGLFAADVLGWEEIQALMADHPEVIAEFYPEHADHVTEVVAHLRSLYAEKAKPARPKPSNLPSSIGHFFKGREAFLEQLRESFRHTPATAITGKAVHGLGGVGKTRTAIEYGHASADDYAATFFLNAKSENDLKDALAALTDGTVLDLPEKDLPDLEARSAASIRWLQANPRWLVIVDNVDDEPAARAVRALLDQISRSEGHLLITSRISDWGHGVEALELELLSLEAAKELLIESTPHRTKPADEEAALNRLADEQLGCLSLALVQSAAYIDAHRIGFVDYSALFDNQATKLLAKLGEAAMRNLSYPLPVALTWQTSIAQLNEAGRLLLDMLAWLSIEPIPRNLFDVWPETETIDLDEGLAELTRYSLVHWEAENSGIRLHRLVGQVTRDNQNAATRDRALNALFPWLHAVNPGMNASDVRCWPQLLPLLPHVLLLFERTNDCGPHPQQVNLYSDFATLLKSLARYCEAEPIFRRALAIDEAQYGANHPWVATRLNNLALMLKITGRLTEAESLYRRALEIDEAAYGPNDWHIANRLSNLAGILEQTDRLVEAEKLRRRALAIVTGTHGPDHHFVAICLNNLATLLQFDNRLTDAEPLYRRALEIHEATYGPEHPTVATGLSNLASLLRHTNRSIEAVPLCRRAALILLNLSKSIGSLLPDAAPAIRNYAFALFDAGRDTGEARAAIIDIMLETGFDPAELWPLIGSEDD